MKISRKKWKAYTEIIARVSGKASDEMIRFAQKNGLDDRKPLIDYAMALTQKYGEGATTAAQNMYDAIAQAQKADVDEAEPADLPDYGEVAKSVNGTLKQSPKGKLIGDSVYRLVKRAGSDTMLKNAKRDHAEFAWINSGDACAFCQMLASRGWQRASKRTVQGDHADHIHANCQCEFAIRFTPDLDVEGYDPDTLREEWDATEGSNSEEKINYLRRKHDAEKNSGAVSSARDTDGKAAEKHAELYYNEIRKRQNDIEKIANASGYSVQEIRDIKDYVFNEKHDLGGNEPEQFAPDYMMAESWRRLQEGKPEPHDLTLLKHETMERELVKQGYSQEEAHIETSKVYNYAKEAEKYYGQIKKYRKE